jgi:hypothetical protein
VFLHLSPFFAKGTPRFLAAGGLYYTVGIHREIRALPKHKQATIISVPALRVPC